MFVTRVMSVNVFLVSAHRRLVRLGKTPKIGGYTFIAPNAAVIGDPTIGSLCAIMYGTVIKGA